MTGFGVYGFDGFRSWKIEDIANQINQNLVDEEFIQDEDVLNLMEFLIYFFHIWDEELYSNPAFNTFNKFAEQKPDSAISLLVKHTQIKNVEIQTQVWRMLSYIAKNFEVPNELFEEASQLLQNTNKDNNNLVVEIVRFLEALKERNVFQFDESTISLMKEYSLFPYIYESTDDIGS